jgi:hypothetical protein
MAGHAVCRIACSDLSMLVASSSDKSTRTGRNIVDRRDLSA